MPSTIEKELLLTTEQEFDARLRELLVAISNDMPSQDQARNINQTTEAFISLLVLVTQNYPLLQKKLFTYEELLKISEQLAKLIKSTNFFSQDERNFFIAGISYLFQNFSEKYNKPHDYKTNFLSAFKIFCPEAFNRDGSLSVGHHNIENPTKLAYIKKEGHSPQIHMQSSIWFDEKPFLIFYAFSFESFLKDMAFKLSVLPIPRERLSLEKDSNQDQDTTLAELAAARDQLKALESTQAELAAAKLALAEMQAALTATQEKTTQETQTLAPELTDTSMQSDAPTTTDASTSTSTDDLNSHSEDSEDSEVARIIHKSQQSAAAPATPAITIATVASPFNLSHSHCVRDCCIGIRALENFLATQVDNIWAVKIHDRMIHSNTSGLAGGLKIGFDIKDDQKNAHTDLIAKITAELEKAGGDFSGEYTDKKIATAEKLLDALSKIKISGKHQTIELAFDNKHDAQHHTKAHDQLSGAPSPHTPPKSPRAVASALTALSVTNSHTKVTTPTKVSDRPPSRLSHGS